MMIKLEINIVNPFRRLPSGRRSRWFVAAGALALAVPVLALAAPVAIPNQFMDGDIISADAFNENFDAIATAINDNDTRLSAVEAPPVVTVRKVTSTGPRNAAIAFCEADEVLTGGGCFLPPENLYDPAYADAATYLTGNFPRPLVGLTSVPVAAGTDVDDIRPRASPGAGIIPFPGDIVAADSGAAVADPGGGWACRAGVVQHNDAGGAQAITTNFYEEWFFYVKAYAVCMSVQ